MKEVVYGQKMPLSIRNKKNTKNQNEEIYLDSKISKEQQSIEKSDGDIQRFPMPDSQLDAASPIMAAFRNFSSIAGSTKEGQQSAEAEQVKSPAEIQNHK